MTTASTAAQSALQGSSAWRLIVAVGLVLGATAFTVQSFVQSTGGEGGGPGQAAESDADPALELCTERPFELTLATERLERLELVEIDAIPLQPCEPRPASAEG